jgi:hypothetical protein
MHFKVVCPECGGVVAQCRCPAPAKTQSVSAHPCAECQLRRSSCEQDAQGLVRGATITIEGKWAVNPQGRK